MLSRELVQTIVLRNQGQASNLRSIQRLASKNMLSGTPVGRAIDHVLFNYNYRGIIDSPRLITSKLNDQIKRLVESMIRCL